MMLRLFLVPGLIVAVLVALFLAGPMLYHAVQGLFGIQQGDERSAEQFLRDLDNPNPDIRWRAGSDLAQVLLRNDRLASDGRFALKLADRLNQTLAGSAAAEKSYADRLPSLSPDDRAREEKKLEPDRTYVQYLTACLGRFMVPVGAPVLRQMAEQEKGLDPKTLATRRGQALFALATLGENLKRLDKLSADEWAATENGLDEAARQNDHPERARAAREYLRKRQSGQGDALGVDRTLEACADADNPFLRELAAFVMNFWTGTPAENDRMEKTLVRLTHDDGRGEDALAAADDRKESKPVTKKPGYKIQVNAAIALARRGSSRTPVAMLAEMLDPELLRQRFVVRLDNGTERPSEDVVVETVLNTLRAVTALHRKSPAFDLSRLRPPIDRLAQDPNPAIRAEVVQTQQALAEK